MKQAASYLSMCNVITLWTGISLFSAAIPVFAAVPSVAELAELSLEELLTIEVTSVAKKPQTIAESAAAVFVITQDDIRRSGVTSIPEALRLAPGVNVGRIDANKWAISIRGFSGRFANKLLVLMDGRSVYTPLFGGVYWDIQDTVLEDIERIEVIRGPGGTLWGANAVNGVINIITKAAKDTPDGLLSVIGGTDEQSINLRYGGSLSDTAFYRLYGKYVQRDHHEQVTGEAAGDDWQVGRFGGRFDQTVESDTVTVQGEWYDGNVGETIVTTSPTAPYRTVTDVDGGINGGFLRGQWHRQVSDTANWTLQGYYDVTRRRQKLFTETRHTFDLDFQYRLRLGATHDRLWGVGYRRTADHTGDTFAIRLDPNDRSDELFSAFVQDDLTLVPDRWRLTLGTKLEHNDYTGFEWQPNVRLLWTPTAQQAMWAAITRAVRTPTRAERYNTTNGLFGVQPPGTPTNPLPIPIINSSLGNIAFDSEKLLAYELGYRHLLGNQASLDLAMFYNRYQDTLTVLNPEPLTCEPGGIDFTTQPFCVAQADFLRVPLPFRNGLDGKIYGFEITADWRPLPRWRVQAHYSYSHTDLAGGDVQLRHPDQQVSVRVGWDPSSAWSLDLWWRFAADVPDLDIDSYHTLDARLAWRPAHDLEWSLVGQNLLGTHEESVSEVGDVVPVQVNRAIYGQVRWSF